MAKLPKVKLVQKKTGRRMNVNAFDYARDINDYVANGWKVVSMSHGDATPGEENLAKIESNIEKYRRENPAEQRKRGDAQRQFEERSISVTKETESAIRENLENESEAPTDAGPEPAADPPKRKRGRPRKAKSGSAS